MILDGKDVQRILDEYEKEIYNEHIKLIVQRESSSVDTREKRDRQKTITAVQVTTVREIRNRLGIPEIKA